MMDTTRRKLVLSTLFGAGSIGLRALATGLPISLLAGMKSARAAEGDAASSSAPSTCKEPQYVLLLTSAAGDPLNANVPGCYVDPGIYHPADPLMAPKPMTLGGKTWTAAAPWASLPPAILARSVFFHHGTYTNSHGDASKVNRLQGAVQGREMLVSMFAKNLAPCLGTVQTQPMVLSPNLITFNGGVQPILSPQNLQAVLVAPNGPLLELQKIRDRNLDKLNALFKQSGTKAQRDILDRYALSQTEARSLSQQLLSDLSQVKGVTRNDLNIATAVLFKMNVSPVAVGLYNFGGDNHGDPGLANETRETVASVAGLVDLIARLTAYGLQDRVTIACQNVFGRTLHTKSHENNTNGRNHNANHHCTVLIGAGLKSSVVGGVALHDNRADYRATGIDSASGASNDGGDIPYDQTFASVGKTFGRAVGLDQMTLDTEISKGKTITSALA